MASSTGIGRISPNSIFFITLAASMVLYLFSLLSVVGLSARQNERLVNYELSLLIKGHEVDLRSGQFRAFSESAGIDGPASVVIVNTFDHSRFESSGNEFTSAQQCSEVPYFQYNISLCRPRLIPWTYLGLITLMYVTIIALAFFAFIKANKAMVVSFTDLFAIAGLQFPENLNFSEAWRFALTMARQFNRFQAQSLEFNKNQAIAQIASQVAHDIRAPVMALQAISGLQNSMSKEEGDLLRSVAARITNIADDLLKRGASETSAADAKESITDARKLLSEIVAEKAMAYHDRSNVSFLLDIDNKSDHTLVVDQGELSRALSNLINNSVEAVNDGGEIKISLRATKQRINFSVADNGNGMNDSVLKRFGEKGFSSGKENSTSGSGLGVYHAKKLVERFGGSFSVFSRVGQGTIVTLGFPRSGSEQVLA